MARWYESNRRLFLQEREALASDSPSLELAVMGPGFQINSVCKLRRECAVVHGTYSLAIPDTKRNIGYGLVVVSPDNYPKLPPDMFCNDPKLPIGNIDRHIMFDGRACLGVPSDITIRWPPGSTITTFLNNLVAPFLAWQFYYDAHQEPPPWGQRSHEEIGILESYAEILEMPVASSTVDFMRLLARKNPPKGHEPCPCNSGRRLRDCHRDLVNRARHRIAWQGVKNDLVSLEKIAMGSQKT